MVPGNNQFKFPASTILVFARAPVINQVKTRLIPALGAEAATQLYQLMLQQTLAAATSSHLCKTRLLCAPDTQHPTFQAFKSRYSVELATQQGNDLGERMYYAAAKALQTANHVVIIGSDCLQLSESVLGQALARLQGGHYDAVVTPAHDGGYVLLGLNRISADLFAHIDWGTERVMAQTRHALLKLNWKWHEFETLRDVDTVDDLEHIRKNEHQYPLSTGVRTFLQTAFSEQGQE